MCCDGHLVGNTRGSWFGNLKPCKYLVGGCTIYKDRPSQCRNYECAWTQGLLPEWMRPDLVGALVSVEIDRDGRQYLKAVCSGELREDVIEEINKFATDNQTYFVTHKVIHIEKQ